MSSKYGITLGYTTDNEGTLGETVGWGDVPLMSEYIYGYLVDIAGVLDYRVSYQLGQSRLATASASSDTFTFTVQYIDGLAALGGLVADAVVSNIAASRITANKPFTLTLYADGVRDTRIDGYLVGRSVDAYQGKQGSARIEYTFQPLPRPWYREKTLAEAGTRIDCYLPADLRIAITASGGAVTDPYVTVRGPDGFANTYAFSGLTVDANTTAVINTRSHAAEINPFGDFYENVYQYRDSGARGSGRYIFEQLPTSGTYTYSVGAASGSPTVRVTAYENSLGTKWGSGQ